MLCASVTITKPDNNYVLFCMFYKLFYFVLLFKIRLLIIGFFLDIIYLCRYVWNVKTCGNKQKLIPINIPTVLLHSNWVFVFFNNWYFNDHHSFIASTLQAILHRKLNVPELHELMSTIESMSITAEAQHLRLQCRQVSLQFISFYHPSKPSSIPYPFIFFICLNIHLFIYLLFILSNYLLFVRSAFSIFSLV